MRTMIAAGRKIAILRADGFGRDVHFATLAAEEVYEICGFEVSFLIRRNHVGCRTFGCRLRYRALPFEIKIFEELIPIRSQRWTCPAERRSAAD